MWRDILLIYPALDPDDTWMEAAHGWVLVFHSGGMRGGSFVLTKLYLTMLPADTLKEPHASICRRELPIFGGNERIILPDTIY